MTLRRRWFRISIRFGLLLVSLIAVLLAVHQYFQAAGERRSQAASTLSELGTKALPLHDKLEFQDFTLTIPVVLGVTFRQTPESKKRYILPKVVRDKPSAMSKLARQVFGNQILDDYGILLVQESISDRSQEFLVSLRDLPNIESIYYYKNTIDESLMQEVTDKNPNVSLIPLESDAPRSGSIVATVFEKQ